MVSSSSLHPSTTLLRLAVAAGFCLHATSTGITKETYSQNAICRQSMCTNPLAPGMMDLARLESITWQCASHSVVNQYMDFCKEAVIYDAALPSPNLSSAQVNLLVKAQDDAAATMFFYHMNGMGYDAWDYAKPSKSSDECVKSVWKMVCYTYFPKMDAGCQANQQTPYRRPCGSVCSNYLSSCQVECCDESPQCIFSHEVDLGGGQSVLQTGYVDAKAPSALCTGITEMNGAGGLRFPFLLLLGIFGLHAFASDSESAEIRTASSGKSSFRSYVLVLVVVSTALFLQGCDVDVPRHNVGNWRRQTDYLVSFEYVPPGQPATAAILNSCSQGTNVAETLQCNGRGYCKSWNVDNPASNALSFCTCDRDFADPECRTKRKSQTNAFILSLFGGFFGLDYFYLGFPLVGLCKLGTLGGFGFWWLTDIIRMGSGPIYAHDYRVAADLPHWVYALTTITAFMIVGFVVGIESYVKYRTKKRAECLKMQRGEEERYLDNMGGDAGVYLQGGPGGDNFNGPRAFAGYGATLPGQMPNADAPYGAAYGGQGF